MRLLAACYIAAAVVLTILTIVTVPDGCVPITKSYWDCP